MTFFFNTSHVLTSNKSVGLFFCLFSPLDYRISAISDEEKVILIIAGSDWEVLFIAN